MDQSASGNISNAMYREESAVFSDLARVSQEAGFVHVLAYFCFGDTLIKYSENMSIEDLEPLYATNRLIRTEISTLLGLMLKQDIDFTLPQPSHFQACIVKAEKLLVELHQVLERPMFDSLKEKINQGALTDVFDNGTALREPIFYAAESAYGFQYIDFAIKRYANDDCWLLNHKGFSIEQAAIVICSVIKVLEEKASSTHQALRSKPLEELSYLPFFTVTKNEIALHAKLDLSVVGSVLNAFTVDTHTCKIQFAALNDFNAANATPLLVNADGDYICFMSQSLAEALYKSPMHWMRQDITHLEKAKKNRAVFTENFATERLVAVFGSENVFQNVIIKKTKQTVFAEIDVLVVFGNRAIVLQAKSKTLTLEARRGNYLQIKKDFQDSIQDACNQAYSCSDCFGKDEFKFTLSTGEPLVLLEKISKIYVMCLVSDHYPALAFQARQFLKYQVNDLVSPPFVLDVFTLDAIAEMLSSPLYFLSYIDCRTSSSARVMSNTELTILACRIKQNIWFSDEYDSVLLEDNIRADLDLAMIVRRTGLTGERMPTGALKHFTDSAFGKLINQIECAKSPEALDLGLFFLTLNGRTVEDVSSQFRKLVGLTNSNGKTYDLSFCVNAVGTGVTIRVCNKPDSITRGSLIHHCQVAKAKNAMKTWFGVCFSADGRNLRFIFKLK